MPDTTRSQRSQTRRPVWRRLLLRAGVGAAGTAGSALVTAIVHWLQHR
ncbi:hypothetical protein ACFUJU_00235 [Streptomyces sp. NPDC057235]